MAPTKEHLAIAASIDKAVSVFPDTAGGMEHLLVRMYKYMPDFKRILETAEPGDLDMLCEQYPHFYRFAKLLEQLAESLAQKKGEAKEAPKPKPKPAPKKPT
jgi:hypothetical protein